MHASFQNIPGTQGHSQKQAKITELPVNPFAKSLGNVRAKEKYRDLCRGTWQGDYSATVHKTNKQRMASAAVWPWRVFTTQKQDDCSIVYAVNVFFRAEQCTVCRAHVAVKNSAIQACITKGCPTL